MNNIQIAQDAYNVIKNGGLALVKADIGYGFLGHSENSIKRMYELKGRPYSNPCITAGNIDIMMNISCLHEPILLEWIKSITKKTTLAVINPVNANSILIQKLPTWVHDQLVRDSTVATFLNTGEYIEPMARLAEQDEILLVGSSGNFSSTGNNYSFEDVPQEIINGVDYYYNAGSSKHKNNNKLATTILNFDTFTIKRAGVNHEMILTSYNDFAKQHNLPLIENK
jgi:tRNA A37 threonylcarbamoyladenosine synthetase subunit TsaC/SUA5/YrdC